MSFYNPAIYEKNYKLAIISVLSDANLGVYERKGTGERMAFCEGYRPLTDEKYFEGYIKGAYPCGGMKFTREILENFKKNYEFIGINSPETVAKNIIYIKERLPETTVLAVMLGGELYYEKNDNPAYRDRHTVHKNINDAVRAIAPEYDIKLIDVNKYLTGQESFYDHFNHYVKPVYYSLAKDIIDLINEITGEDIKESPKGKMALIKAKETLAPAYYKLRKFLKK